jgi:putative membrane protein
MNHALALTNAVVTTLALTCMIAGWRAIRRRDVRRHKQLMVLAAGLSAVFVAVFLLRFVEHGFTPFQGSGVLRGIYYFVFFSHEPLAVVNVPLVLVALGCGLFGAYAVHKEVARYALPIWIYVAVTGVLIYMLVYLA